MQGHQLPVHAVGLVGLLLGEEVGLQIFRCSDYIVKNEEKLVSVSLSARQKTQGLLGASDHLVVLLQGDQLPVHAVGLVDVLLG